MTERMTTANMDTTTLLSLSVLPVRYCDDGSRGWAYQLQALSADTTGFMVAMGRGDKVGSGR